MKGNKNARIYVAGHNGMVGSAVTARLRELGYDNIITRSLEELDLRNQSRTEQFFDKERPEYIFLAAAKVGGIVANSTYKAEFIYDNIMIAANVINSAWKFSAKKLLNFGSSCIYPKLAPQPLSETSLLTGLLEETNEPYAIAKIAAIKLCNYYKAQYGCDFFSIMPTNLYGKNDNYNLETSHVLPAMIRKILLAKALDEGNFEFITRDLSSKHIGFGLDKKYDKSSAESALAILKEIGIDKGKIKIWGSGKVYREFLHCTDLARGAVHLMENYSSDEIGDFVNIGTGSDLSIADLVKLICNIAGYGGEICYDSSKPDGTPKKLLDVSRINNLGWKAEITLEQGIRSVMEDYGSNYIA